MAFKTLLIPYSHSQTHMHLSAIAHIKARSWTINTYLWLYRCMQELLSLHTG